MAMHRHSRPYAALVLDGGYEEHGPDGRFSCRTGRFIVHPAWHQHADSFSRHGAVVLNLPLEHAAELVFGKVADLAALESLARRSPSEAGRALAEEADVFEPRAPAPWLKKLVSMMIADEHSTINDLAARCGVSPEHASRACRRWYGLSPTRMRRESRIQHAIKLLRQGASPSEAANEAGFSDQPHLTRLLKQATGRTPSKFRRH